MIIVNVWRDILKNIMELFKGVVIGVANILPGISGGMLAITMGVYDKIIHAVTHFFKEPVKSTKTLLPYGVGALIGIIFLSLAFEYFFHTYPLQTKSLFLGLIGGGLPALLHRSLLKGYEDWKKGISIAIFTCMVVILFTLFAESVIDYGKEGVLSLTSGRYWVLSLLFAGFLMAVTMVIPGVSGSMLMMILGFYEPILQTNNACIRSLSARDLTGLVTNGLVLLPYATGIVFGVFLCARIIENLLLRHERHVYRVVTGLVLSSPFVVLRDIPWHSVKGYELMWGISLAFLGYVTATLLGGEG